MWKLLQIELFKIYRRPRTYIAFGAIAAMIAIIQLGLKVDGKEYMEFMMSGLNDSFSFEGKMLNGYFVCYILLNTLLIHVPLLISLIAADMISGEANVGTLRLLLTKPISRTSFILAKFLAATIYTITLLIWLAVLALFVSMAVFGTDDLFVLKNWYLVQLSADDVFWRYTCAFGFAALAMTTVAALGFFFSLFAENSIGPIVATISVIIVTTILSTMSVPIFNAIKPYLFTTHMVTWKEFFDEKVNANNEVIKGSIQNPDRIITSVIVLSVHIVAFVGASIWIFKRKDVLS
jgi:ABC-2 type transport system permease protein